MELYDKLIKKNELTTTELYQYQRFLSLRKQLAEQCGETATALNAQTTAALTKAYKDTFHTVNGLLNVSSVWGIQNQYMLNKVLNKKWCGSNFSSRIWKNTNSVAKDVESAVVSCVTRGVSKDVYVKMIKDRYNVGFFKADRLVRTELMHTINEAQRDTYRADGVSEVEWRAAEDERMCAVCGSMHGEIFKIDKAPALAHANCRCTILPVIETIDFSKMVDNPGESDIIKSVEKEPINYKQFDINNQQSYDDWANTYYTKNKSKLTSRDYSVLKEYTDGSYEAINAANRFEVGSEPYNKVCRQYGVNNLDKYKKLSDDISKAIKKFDLDKDIICHRYVSKADYITGAMSSTEDLKNAIGKEYTEKGFTSTCLFEHLTKKFGGKTPIHLEIRIPKGTAGAYINDFSEKKNLEWEYLLDRGTRFKVLEGGERKAIENKWIAAERAWKDVEVTEKYMILEVLK